MTGLLLSVLVAATPITLDEVRAEARNNLTAIQAELTWVESYENVANFRGALLPQLFVGYSASFAWNTETRRTVVFSGNAITSNSPPNQINNYQVGANLTQTIVNVAQWFQLKQAGELERANKGLAQDQEDASELEAIRRFYVLFTAQGSLDVLEQTAEKSKELWDRAEALYNAGKGIKGDALAAQVNYGTDQNNAIQQHIALVQAQADLAAWLGRPETDELVAVQPRAFGQMPPPSPSYTEAAATAKQQRAILRAYAAQIDAAQSNITVQQANLFPKLSLNGQVFHNSNDFGTAFYQWGINTGATLSVNLNWQIFDGMSTFALSRQAEEQTRAAKATYSQSERDVDGQIRTTLNALADQVKALDVLTVNRAAAAKNLEYFQERFNAGASNTLDVRDAQVKLLSAELSLLQTRANVENAQASLARAMGTLSNGAKP